MDKLREIAKAENITLSDLLRRLTEEVAEKYGKKYQKHNEEL